MFSSYGPMSRSIFYLGKVMFVVHRSSKIESFVSFRSLILIRRRNSLPTAHWMLAVCYRSTICNLAPLAIQPTNTSPEKVYIRVCLFHVLSASLFELFFPFISLRCESEIYIKHKIMRWISWLRLLFRQEIIYMYMHMKIGCCCCFLFVL